ncbi:MAG: acyl carrier protein [Bacteroidaceae bacterium]|nr:acyl carrier protein [Bacteroidaceae bacterium]
MEIKEFIEKFADIFEDVDAESLTPETKFRELDEWSSLEALCVISMASDEFGKQIKNADLKNCCTIEDLYNLIVK